MRSIILTAVLGLASLGLLTALPTEAKAWPPRYMNTFSVGPYSRTTMIGNPYFNSYVNPFYGAGITYGSPAMMSSYINPRGFGAMYTSPGLVSYNYSAYGLGYYVATPGYAGYSFSPYTGFRRFYLPGSTYSVPYDTSSYGGGGLGYYNSYVPGGYALP